MNEVTNIATKKRNYQTDAEKNDILHKLREVAGGTTITSKAMNEFIKANGLATPHFIINDKKRNPKWGVYTLEPIADAAPAPTFQHGLAAEPPKVDEDYEAGAFIPQPDATFVPHGFYEDLKSIVESDRFFPTLITGDSGNGKTVSVMQACAEAGRECVRINCTKDSDEGDFIGSYELVDGETIWREGPAIMAYRRGSKLLLDEVDYASEKILCLQSILEGKPIFCKKRKIMIYPAVGFNVFATANTKGRGSDDGRYVGANILNDAFLERFAITVEQGWPTESLEKKMLLKNFIQMQIQPTVENDAFLDVLIKWAANTRKTHKEGGVDDQISTRRLVHIVNAYSMFGNRDKAVNLCLNRFTEETKIAIFDLYKKVDDVAQKVKDHELREKQKANVSTKPAPTAQPQQGAQVAKPSDIKFMAVVGNLKKIHNTEISANEILDPATNVKSIAVTSHGWTSTKPLDEMGKPGSPEFEKLMNGMVQVNSAKAVVSKNKVKPRTDAEKASLPF